jgi:hypothetical protein
MMSEVWYILFKEGEFIKRSYFIKEATQHYQNDGQGYIITEKSFKTLEQYFEDRDTRTM